MHEFKVWAPYATKMAVSIGGGTYPMRTVKSADRFGWWCVVVEQAGPGTDYAFLIDDDPSPYPDPRSAWQPHGVHGPSRVVDHKSFRWNDTGWQGTPLASAVIYELHVGTFTAEGTFDAAISRLEHVVKLGVTHIELMPVAPFPGGFGWGYDGVSMFAVGDTYGGPVGLKRLVSECHRRGLGVILDVVYNHFGPVGNYTGKFGPYLTDRHHTPWGGAMNFEGTGSDEVRRFFCDNAAMWLRDYHMDGLRLDAVHEFMDRSAINFMEQLSAEVEVLSSAVGRKLFLIAESDLNDPRVVRTREARGYGLDAQWSDDFHHALFTVLNTQTERGYYHDFGSLEILAKALKEAFVYDGQYSKYRGHSHGRPVEGLSAHHFVSFIQNHDQVGNRATGDRLEHVVGMDRAKIAAALVMTSPFIPLILEGEEFAASTPFQYFADHDDPEMAKSVSEGRRREFAGFGWPHEVIPDPGSRETFERSKLDWSEAHEGRHAEMLEWYTRLIHLRRSSLSLNDGDLAHIKVTFDEEARCLTVERGPMRVICNLGDQTAEFENRERQQLVLGSRSDVQVTESRVVLPPDTVAIVSAVG